MNFSSYALAEKMNFSSYALAEKMNFSSYAFAEKMNFSSYALAYVDFLLYLCSGNRERSVMSPTFLKEKGYSFKIYSNEEVRMHIHIIKDNKEAKFWLEPQVELAYKGDYCSN